MCKQNSDKGFTLRQIMELCGLSEYQAKCAVRAQILAGRMSPTKIRVPDLWGIMKLTPAYTVAPEVGHAGRRDGRSER